MGDLHDEFKEMMKRRDLWTDEMHEIHARRKAAVDTILRVLASLDDDDRTIIRDRLLDLWDMEVGELDPSDVSPW